jgi:hypothetical protein
LTFQRISKEQSGDMLDALLGLFRLIWLFGKGHHAVVLENLALRQQIAVYKRKQKRPRPVQPGPLVLDRTVPRVEGSAASLVHRSFGLGGALAAGAFPPMLGEPVAEVRNTRTTAGQP